MREEFFSKFKDYNKELEKILEKKDFSKDTKNLLLSMFYKLDISYNDYYLVKKNSKSKQEYLNDILRNVKNSNNIELVNPSDSNFESFKLIGLYDIDLKLKKIKVLSNELALLSAILELNNFQIHLDAKYDLIKMSMPYLLNMAYEMENVEVLRDFNAWSWNIQVYDIKNITINLIYQTLKIALNQDIFEKIQMKSGHTDMINIIEQRLTELYGEKLSLQFLQLIFKLSILIYIKENKIERKRLSDKFKVLEKDLQNIKDKKNYIENMINEKKILTKELKKIDLIMNNNKLLLEEYEKRNKLLSEYNKIFSISHLVEKLQKERNKILSKMEVCSKKIEPSTYVIDKNKLQKEYDLLKDIKFDNENDIYKYIDKLQEIFIQEILRLKIKKLNESIDIINCIYELRYYNFLPYTKENNINSVEKFKEILEYDKEILIKKAYDFKLINTISTNEISDIKIVKNIFNLKTINLEDIYIEIKKKNDKYIVNIFDGKETLEQVVQMDLMFNEKDKIKLNRKIKLFI